MDVSISGGGMDTVYSVLPISDEAKAWVERNIELESYQWLGPTFIVEHRYIGDLVTGMLQAGLHVEWNGVECMLTSA